MADPLTDTPDADPEYQAAIEHIHYGVFAVDTQMRLNEERLSDLHFTEEDS